MDESVDALGEVDLSCMILLLMDDRDVGIGSTM